VARISARDAIAVTDEKPVVGSMGNRESVQSAGRGDRRVRRSRELTGSRVATSVRTITAQVWKDMREVE
jgi:hypothetical protein